MSKKTDTKSSPEALSSFSAFMLGAVSKCAATCLTYPAIRCMINLIYIPLEFLLSITDSSEYHAKGSSIQIYGLYGCILKNKKHFDTLVFSLLLLRSGLFCVDRSFELPIGARL